MVKMTLYPCVCDVSLCMILKTETNGYEPKGHGLAV